MKNKLLIAKVKRMLESKEFVFIYLVLFALGIINFVTDMGDSYFSSIIGLTDSYMNIILIFCIMYSSFFVARMYGKSYSLITRYNDKKEYIEDVMKINTIISFLIVLLYFMIGIIFLTFKYNGNYVVVKYLYDMNIFSYLIFFFIRYVIIMLLLSNFMMLVLKNFSKMLSSVLMAISVFLLYGPIYVATRAETLKDVLFLPGYFLSVKAYASFSLEFSASLFMILILLIMVYTLYIITCKRTKNDYLITD